MSVPMTGRCIYGEGVAAIPALLDLVFVLQTFGDGSALMPEPRDPGNWNLRHTL